MERLTEHHVNKTLGAYMVCSGACIDDNFDCNGCKKLEEMVDRLAAYEDALPLERAQELAQAEKDGRLVVLPPNDPLPPEELRKMGRDWVWIELLAPLYRMDTGYYLKKAQFSDTNKFCCGYPGLVIRDLPYSLYGDSWIAYRRKPEEGTT